MFSLIGFTLLFASTLNVIYCNADDISTNNNDLSNDDLFDMWKEFEPKYFFKKLLLFQKPILDADMHRNAPQLIASRGFLSESYQVLTQDGYVVTVQRIVNPKRSTTAHLKPVLLQHGILKSADGWLINSEGRLRSDGIYVENNGEIINECNPKAGESTGKTIGFVLAACGYDVWLGNSRGNRYSSSNQKYANYDSRFWDFSWEEMALYDTPAVIDFILTKTNKSSLAYIGFSQGNTIGFTMLSLKPEYSKKISLFIALAPITYLAHMSPFIKLAAFVGEDLLRDYLGPLGVKPNVVTNFFINTVCNKLTKKVCSQLISISDEQLNLTRVFIYLAHRDRLASKNLNHFAQSINSGLFRRYDYGPMENLRTYGQLEPPDYPLESIPSSQKIALINSKGDFFSRPEDVKLLKRHLKAKIIDHYLIPDENFYHFDFQLALSTGAQLHPKILNYLQTYA